MQIFRKAFRMFFKDIFNHENLDWTSFFLYLNNLTYLFGVTSAEITKTTFGKFINYGQFLLVVAMPTCGFITMITDPDQNRRIQAGLPLTGGIHIITKILFLWMGKSGHNKLKAHISHYTKNVDETNHICREELIRYHKYASWAIISVFIVFTLELFGFLITPLFFERQLPLYCPIYGFPYDESPYFEINYCVTSFQFINFIPPVIAADSIFYLFCFYVLMRLEICSRHCAYIGDKSSKCNTEEKQTILLEYIVKNHAEVLEFLADFKNICELYLLVNFVTFISINCVSIAQMLVDFPLTTVFSASGAIVQMFLFSLFGQLLLSKAERYMMAIYDSQWSNLEDMKNRKMVLLILMNAQSFKGLTFKGIAQLRLESFAEILKFCYAFTAAFRNML